MDEGIMDSSEDLIRADKEARLEALNPEGSFIVQAPAGSGKTELLIQRFLKLLATVGEPEEVLAITFTNKAAGEMHSRIVEALEGAAGDERPVEEHELLTHNLAAEALKRGEKEGWGLLANPARLKVMTISSLCASTVRQVPVLSSLAGNPAIREVGSSLYRSAGRRVTELMEGEDKAGEVVRGVLSHLDNSVTDLERRIELILRGRERWRGLRPSNGRGDLESLIKEIIEETLERCSERWREEVDKSIEESLVRCASYAGAMIGEGPSPIRALKGIGELPGTGVESISKWRGVAELLTTKGGGWRKRVDKGAGFPSEKDDGDPLIKGEMVDLLKGLNEGDFDTLLNILGEVKRLPDGRYTEEEWEVLGPLLEVFPLALRCLHHIFEEEWEVDFPAISIGAIDSLGGGDDPSDLMLALDMRYSHILIDEYQDTSRTHLEFIEALTSGWCRGDGRTLFIVGDPMQSIYLFNDARVTNFIEGRERGIGDITLKGLNLRRNFRSEVPVIDWVNSAFPGILGGEGPRGLGSIPYEPFVGVKGSGSGAEVRGSFYTRRDDTLETEDCVELISRIREEYPGESIGVLGSVKGHLKGIVTSLKERSIPIEAVELDPLKRSPLICDLTSLVRGLRHLGDKVAWLGLLRSPLCGLTLKDIHGLVNSTPDAALVELILDCARSSQIPSVSEDGVRRLKLFGSKVASALSLWGRTSPRVVVEGLWVDLGGPGLYGAVAGSGGDVSKESGLFFDLLDEVSRGGTVDIRVLEDNIDSLTASYTSRGGSPVEVMTIHKAKGLEFDHVIMPGLGKRGGRDEKPLIRWDDLGEGKVLLGAEERKGWPENPVYRLLKERGDKRLALERGRLLYVGATRARRSLHLYGHVNELKDGGYRAAKGSLLHAMNGAIDGEDGWIREVGRAEGAADKGKGSALFRRVNLSWKRPPVKGPIPHLKDTPRVSPSDKEMKFEWARESKRHLGTVLHDYLCRVAVEGLDGWTRERIEGGRERVVNGLRSLGVDAEEAEALSREGVEILTSAVDDEVGRWALGRYEGSEEELPLTAYLDGEVIGGVIDRTFIERLEGKQVRWILDYKTGVHEGGGVEAFLDGEAERYGRQMSLYERMIRARGERDGEVVEIRKALYYPALGRLKIL